MSCRRVHEGDATCTEMGLDEFLAWWRQHREQAGAQRQQPDQLQPRAAAEQQAADGSHGHQQAQRAQQGDGAPLWYCKDMHLAASFPRYHAYTCPPYFQDDWLNEWHDSRRVQQEAQQEQQEQQQAAEQPQQCRRQDWDCGTAAVAATAASASGAERVSDYRFVYLGPAGTCTPLHADVLRSYSWSANVAGRKRWRLLPPQHAHLVMDRRGRDAPPGL